MAKRRTSTIAVVGQALLLAGLVVLVLTHGSTLRDASAQMTRAEVVPLVAAFFFVVAGFSVGGTICWVVVTRRITGVGFWGAASAWLGASLAKYVPGFVWHPVSTVGRLQQRGALVTQATLVFIVDASAWVVSAVLVGLPAIPVLVGARTAGTVVWLALTLPALAVLHPRVFAFGMRLAGRVIRRQIEARIDWRLVGTAVGLHTAAWLMIGAGLFFVQVALRQRTPFILALASAALSWAAGYLFLIAPAGFGVREATLIALLAVHLPLAEATTVALLWRALFVTVDILGFAASLVIDHAARRRRQQPVSLRTP